MILCEIATLSYDFIDMYTLMFLCTVPQFGGVNK